MRTAVELDRAQADALTPTIEHPLAGTQLQLDRVESRVAEVVCPPRVDAGELQHSVNHCSRLEIAFGDDVACCVTDPQLQRVSQCGGALDRRGDGEGRAAGRGVDRQCPDMYAVDRHAAVGHDGDRRGETDRRDARREVPSP